MVSYLPQVRAGVLVGQRCRAEQLADGEALGVRGAHPVQDRRSGLRLRPGPEVPGRAQELGVGGREEMTGARDQLRVPMD
jgi:hypothetical protein